MASLRERHAEFGALSQPSKAGQKQTWFSATNQALESANGTVAQEQFKT